MTTKEQIIQELEKTPESLQQKVLAYIRSLNSEENKSEDEVWQAYLESEKSREEVYRRLANS